MNIPFLDGTTRNERALRKIEKCILEQRQRGFSQSMCHNLLNVIDDWERKRVLKWITEANDVFDQCHSEKEWLTRLVVYTARQQRRDPEEIVREIEVTGSMTGTIFPPSKKNRIAA